MTGPRLTSANAIQALPDHVHGFALVHVAMRRDARRLVAVAPHVTATTVGAVGAWFQQVFDAVEWHQRTEDEVLFPELRRFLPAFAAREQALVYDHVLVDLAMAEVAAALSPSGDRTLLPSVSRRFRTVLFEHLNLEETVVFPALVTMDAYPAVERRMMRTAPPVVFPWMFDGIDRRTASVALPLRGRLFVARTYRRTVAPVVALARESQEEK
jgi:hypothetical protein